ncbi:MAG: sulfatase-like hydrolase/transferase [Myxococcales bacterium]|nr:sulfatase-like hydrolase/transferase [Myxococcales bacterium]
MGRARTSFATSLVVAAACGSHGATPPPTPTEPRALHPAAGGAATTDAPDAPAAPAPPPRLAAAPRLDLDANRPRWHVYQRGLVIPIAGEGLRKYDLTYRSPWSAARGAGDDAYRTARGKAALTFPWTEPTAAGEVIVRGRGLTKARLALDGRRLTPTSAADTGAVFALPAAGLGPGEHVVTVEGSGARWHSLEIAPADTTPCPAPDTWRRIALYTELPRGAHLAGATTDAGPIQVTVTDEAGATTEVYAGPAAGLATPVALPAAPDRVVRLDLTADVGCARWDGLAIGVVAPPAPPAPPPPVDNVVLVVVDTLRADRLTAYGATRVETPRLTEAAERGAVFLRNQSMAPSSPPSHATIHTGQIPRVHGIAGDDGTLAADAPFLAAILTAAGFSTHYVGNNDFAMSRFKQVGRWASFETPYYAHGKDCAPIVAQALAHATAAHAAGRRFFVSLLPIEPHVAYRFHEGVTERYWPGPWPRPFAKRVTGAHLGRIKSMRLTADDWQRLRALYDGEVTHFDQCFGALEDGLRTAGLLERTAVIVASDHGEGQGERGGRAGHAYSLNRELVATPLIVIGGVAPGRVATPTSNLDLAPTVLALLGLPADPRMQGQSLVPLTGGATALPTIVASEYGRSYALRAGRWHLVVDYDGTQHLYDVAADADEDHDRAADAPLALRYLRDAAGLYLAHRAAWHAVTWGTLAALAPGNPLAAAALPSAR